MAKKKHTVRKIHVTSTVSMSLVLFLVGMVLMLLLVGRDMSTYVKENINLSVVLNDDIIQPDEQRIEHFLINAQYAREVKYISKDEALKDHIASLGDNPADFLGYNPLKASIEVKLHEKYANPDSVKMIEAKIRTFDKIDRVIYQKEMVSLVNDNITRISYVLLGLAGILLFVSVVLVSNTIRMSLYSNRFLINTMKLVGATPGFIRKPYVRNTMLKGLLASLIAVVMLVAVIMYVQYEFQIPDMLLQWANMAIAAAMVMATGLFLAFLSSYFAVNRYLKMNSNDLHFV